MSKRAADNEHAIGSKRQKTAATSQRPVVEEIVSARQLQKCLAFHQDAVPEIRKGQDILPLQSALAANNTIPGLRSCKTFLETILYAEDRLTSSRQRVILQDFLRDQIPHDLNTEATVACPDLLQAWRFAAQTNNDSLLSAVPALLALLLRTISTSLELRDQGLALCRTILQTPQLKLISQGLSAPKHKGHVISPCIRLLTEVVSFDGGTLASRVFAARQYTFDVKVLPRSLSLYTINDNAELSLDRPSIRSNAVRYVLANFKFQKSAAKAELIKSGSIVRALFDHVKHDSLDTLRDIFKTFRKHVYADASMSGSEKGHILNANSLSHLASLWRHDEILEQRGSEKETNSIVREFLSYVCSDPAAGLVRSSYGWYPPGADIPEPKHASGSASEIDLGLDSVPWYNSFHNHVPIRSTTLALFAQNLRPYSSLNESELLLTIFKSCPELVADYFNKKTGFAFDPKLTSTWMGYYAFLFPTVRLEIPAFFGYRYHFAKVPPPISIVMENLLPEPLTNKVLTRCLNQQCGLITFFATRLIVAAFMKIQECLKMFSEAAKTQGDLWHEAAARLLAEFSLRCPRMKDVVATYRKTPAANQIQREVVLRLLKLYYEVTPQIAFEEKLDISIPLSNALERVESHNGEADIGGGLNLIELSHLLHIALWSPDMKWWQKPTALQYSPFITLLRVVVLRIDDHVVSQLIPLLSAVASEAGLLQTETIVPSVDALIFALRTVPAVDSDCIYEFLDDVCGRIVRQPIKYEDDLAAIQPTKPGQVSLLWAAIAEQWRFASAKPGANTLAAWISQFRSRCHVIGEEPVILSTLMTAMQKATEQKALQNLFLTDCAVETEITPRLLSKISPAAHVPGSESAQPQYQDLITSFPSLKPPPEPSKHTGLHRWSTPTTKDLREAFDDGSIAELISCLASNHAEVRELAITNLNVVLVRVAAIRDTYPDAAQLYLLLGELIATATPLVSGTDPVSTLVIAYAAATIPVLTDPLHSLYETICRFHTRGPSWVPSRLPSQLIHRVLFSTPSATPAAVSASGNARGGIAGTSASDGSRSSPDLAWLLAYLLAGLCTPSDLSILQARGSFEPLFALAVRPGVNAGIRGRVLALVWRASCIQGGSTTLATRAGVFAWLGALIADTPASEAVRGRLGDADNDEARVELNDEVLHVLATRWGMCCLVRRLWETCDRERVDAWSAGTMEKMVHGIIQDHVA